MDIKDVYNEYFELIHLMKRKEGCLTDDEFIIFMYMFNLRKANMNEKEKENSKKKTEYLYKLLNEYYEKL